MSRRTHPHLRSITAMMKEGANALDLDQFIKTIWLSIANSGMSGKEYLVECLERFVAQLFAFFLIKDRRERESYLFSAAQHERIIEACPG